MFFLVLILYVGYDGDGKFWSSRNGSIGGRARAFESDGDKGTKRQTSAGYRVAMNVVVRDKGRY